jgi:hypothetical protein
VFGRYFQSETKYFKEAIENGIVGENNNKTYIIFENYALELDLDRKMNYDPNPKTLIKRFEYSNMWFKIDKTFKETFKETKKPALIRVLEWYSLD